MSKAADQWDKFADAVHIHVNDYVVPQYGDIDDELAKDWSAADCIKQAQTYAARFGKSNRIGEEELDLIKAAHWMQKAWQKVREAKNRGRPVPEHGSGP